MRKGERKALTRILIRKPSSNGAVRMARERPQNIRFTDSMENKTSQQRDYPIVEGMTEDGHCTFTVCPMPPFAPRHRWLKYTERAGGLAWELRFGLHSEERGGEERAYRKEKLTLRTQSMSLPARPLARSLSDALCRSLLASLPFASASPRQSPSSCTVHSFLSVPLHISLSAWYHSRHSTSTWARAALTGTINLTAAAETAG